MPWTALGQFLRTWPTHLGFHHHFHVLLAVHGLRMLVPPCVDTNFPNLEAGLLNGKGFVPGAPVEDRAVGAPCHWWVRAASTCRRRGILHSSSRREGVCSSRRLYNRTRE
jgi:hypothetical protein